MEMSSEHFQTALREVIEKFYKTTRFIFTCNFVNKVIEPLKSRTQEFKFGDINKIDIMKRLFAILKQEGVEFKKEDVAAVIKDLGTDMRRIINTLQKLTEKREDGSLYLTKLSSLDEKQGELLDLIKNKKLTDFRKSLGKSNIGADEFIKFLFNKAFDKQLGNRWVEIIAELSEAAYRLKLGVDPEITVINTVCQVMQLIEE
jgi:replication factor C small subunit